MQDFLQSVLDGVATGSLYAMIALGYTLVYGIVKLINFAHGEFYMVGAYVGFYVLLYGPGDAASPWTVAGLLLLAVAGSAAAASILAIATERVAYRPIRKYDRIVALLTAIGVSFLLQNLARIAFSPNPQSYVAALRGGARDLPLARFLDWYQSYSLPFDFEIQNAKILILAVSAVSMGVLYVLVMKTRVGKAMRATAQDIEAARLMGIDTDRVIALTFALGGLFAGVAGMLSGMLYNINPMMGFLPGLKAFVAAVVGGIGSIPGAVIGGLAIGLAESLAVFANLPTEYKDAVAFAILVVILLLRPQGILGTKRTEKV
ncbi:branched-chain amino acid ABC transporter permease [Candidatus Sumerlaeota bacterium]|nr:branched-chain amino acid ABC transporter permease [Candidatus Sumerlaeota bacterium]